MLGLSKSCSTVYGFNVLDPNSDTVFTHKYARRLLSRLALILMTGFAKFEDLIELDIHSCTFKVPNVCQSNDQALPSTFFQSRDARMSWGGTEDELIS